MTEAIEREIFETDILFIGAGPACLAGAIRLQNLVDDYNEEQEENGGETIHPKITVLEKGNEVGAHGISGAVLDPRALNELFPGWKEDETFPVERFVERECMLMLTENSSFTIPVLPPEFHDMGKPIISIAKFQVWLAERCEERGIEVLPGTAGNTLLYNDDGQCIGVRTRDFGIGPDGQPRDDFEPGSDFPCCCCSKEVGRF